MSADKDVRIQFRTTLKEKMLFEHAASLCGFSDLSKFLKACAHEKIAREASSLNASVFKDSTELSAKASLKVAQHLVSPTPANTLLCQTLELD